MSSKGPGFELARVPIPGHLARFVDSWLGYREVSELVIERVEHPSGRAVLIFEFGEPIELCGRSRGSARFRTGFFAGIDDEPTLTRFSGEQAGIEVNLSPEGSFALTAGGLGGLRGLVVESADLGIDPDLGSKLRESPSWEARFQLVADALWERLQRARPLSRLVGRALALIDADHGALTIERLSRSLGVSRTYLHQRFVVDTGFAPKRYAELRRFTRVKGMLRSGEGASLASVAAHAGYSDHAHLSREVRRFSGMTPGELAREVRQPMACEVERMLSEGGASCPDRV